MRSSLSTGLALAWLGGCAAAPEPECHSLAGRPLFAPALADGVRAEREQQLAQARAALARNPAGLDELIRVGRRAAYLGRFREAIATYTRGLELHAGEPRLLRHRGHRFLTTRRFRAAIADLVGSAAIRGRPDEVEPDGLPNERGIPTSTLHANVWYHLGLARYLDGDFAGAARAHAEGMQVSANPDMLCATAYWYWQALRRLGRDDEAARLLAPIHADLDVIENGDYLELLLLYRGERAPQQVLARATDPASVAFATVGYGVARWYLQQGRDGEARELLQRVVAAGQWPAFGHLAAEVALSRDFAANGGAVAARVAHSSSNRGTGKLAAVDDSRRQRYLDKVATIELRARQVSEWTEGVEPDDLSDDPRTQLAVYKALQEVVESATDLCAMRARDEGLPVKDDYGNIDALHARGDLPPDVADSMREGNGLRNRLVHHYDDLRDELVLSYVRTRLATVLQVAREVRRWLAS